VFLAPAWVRTSCLNQAFYAFSPPSFLQERTVKNFSQVDAEFGRKLTEGLRKHAKNSNIAYANL
jgi:hypothetical protein